MNWPHRDTIAQGVADMLRVNMGLKSGERLLVMADVPRIQDWQAEIQAKLEEMLERAVLARLVAEVAAERFPDCPVSWWPFPSTGRHGVELDDASAARMCQADVVIAITSYSLSHTNARTAANQAGARLASMPEFDASMFAAGGPMAADYQQIGADCRAFAELLSAADQVRVCTSYGTDVRFRLGGRPGKIDAGLYTQPGIWGNLPAGEAFAIPLEGTGEGQLVAPAGWYPRLTEDMLFRIEQGVVVEVRGGGAVGDKYRALLNLGSQDPAYQGRRNLAELGVGTNPKARKPDNVLEAEKIKGTVHLAIGDNIHMGGQVEADLHQDFVQPKPDLFLDGRAVIVGGEWRI